MTQIESMYLQDSRVKRAFFESNAAVIATSDLAKEDVGLYLALLIVFETRIEEEKTFDATTGADKQTSKGNITDKIMEAQDKLVAHAIKTDDAALKEAMKAPASSFKVAKDEDFIEKVNAAITQFNANAAVLTKYGLSATFADDLAKDLADYKQIKPNMAVDRSKSAVITQNLHSAYDKLKEFTEKVLPISLATLATPHPDFINAYNRLITTSATVQGIKFSVKVVNAATKKAESGVTIDIPELGMQLTTDDKGIVLVKTGIITDVTVKASKETSIRKTLRSKNCAEAQPARLLLSWKVPKRLSLQKQKANRQRNANSHRLFVLRFFKG
jgi:hypothetical protein